VRVHDLTLPIQDGMSVWPGDPPVRVRRVASLEAGDEASVSEVTLGSHTGTHVDAPAHLLRGGAPVDALELEHLIGVAVVAHVPGLEHITAATLEALRLPEGCRRLLFRTHNSDVNLLGPDFHPDYVALRADAGEWLARRDLLLVGIDAPSVDPYEQEAGPVHHLLLERGVILVEGLNMRGIAPGVYHFCCLPLNLVGADGAPARAVLIDRCADLP